MKRIILFLSFLLSLACYGQSYKLFTTDRHLSSSLVNYIFEDSKGMIWIATEDGLNRYDGAKFTIYKHHPGDEHSLAHNNVSVIFEDSKGNIFVGSYGGLQIYDRTTDSFSNRAIWKDGKSFHNNVKSMLERHDGELWTTGDRLAAVSIENGQPIVSSIDAGVPEEMTGYLMEDDESNTWISRGEDGIYQLSPDKKLKFYFQSNKESDASITSLCKDKKGNIYAGSNNNGLLKLDKNSMRFIPIESTERKNLIIKSLYTSNDGKLFLCTDGKGMKVYDTETEELSDFTFESNFETNHLKIHCAIQDHAGNIWLGIYQKGIVMIPATPDKFGYIGYRSVQNNYIGTSCITSIMRSQDGSLWVGTDNEGIYRLDENGQPLKHYEPEETSNSVPAIIVKVFEDSEKNIWFTSFTNGMGRINPANGVCTYQQDLIDKRGKKIRHVYDLVEDNSKRMWTATLGHGLYYYDMKEKRTVYDAKVNKGLNQWIYCLYYSRDNKLYIGTYSGMEVIDLNKEFKAEKVLSRRIVYSIFEDNQGRIWAGSSDGLAMWNPETKETKQYTIETRLAGQAVYAIRQDDKGYLWISTNSGLSQFHIDEEKFNNYYVSDGLQGNEFSKNCAYKDADGTLWFGGVNGITHFHPQNISDNSKKWDIRFTGFIMQNGYINTRTLSDGNPIINQPIYETKDIYLAHHDNTFSIEFATLDYNVPERVQYVCSINDKEWIYLPTGVNSYPFYDLTPGTYRFKVCADDNGILSEAKEITIHISPVWYDSVWAKIIYLMLGLAALILFNIQMKARYKAKQEMQEHIHAEEIKDAKLQFFTNISHEIRTPISFIINPLSKLMDMDKDAERTKIYHTIHLNSDRILRLINQLMDVQKIDQGMMRLAYQETELIKLTNDVCALFKEHAEDSRTELNFYHEGIEELNVWIDPNHFDKVIPNLLSNAFKFTPENGKIEIYLSTGVDESTDGPLRNYAEIIVKDNGKGIDEKEKEQIFNAFYQVPESQNMNLGTGIGLHLTRSVVELHHGTITCNNNTDEPGCHFTIRIPLGNSHLKDEEMVQESATAPQNIPEAPIYYADMESEDEIVEGKNKNIRHHILVVEDNEEIRRYIHLELANKYHVKECANGKEALEELFNHQYDLVISDIMMPEMDGLTLCRKIKSNINFTHIPVILLTAKTQEEDNIEALERGADAYITKPFNSKILEKTIRNLIHTREQLKSIFGGDHTYNEQLEKIEVQSPDEKLMARIMKVINNNLSNSELTTELIAIEVGTSRIHLNRKLKELTNQTTREFIKNCRLKQAATLLSEKKHNISEIAELTGFSSPNNFATAFKELFGVSPSVYKEHLDSKKEGGCV